MSAGALTRRGILLAVTGLSLYLLAPALLEVFGAFDELDEIAPWWFPAMVALQVGSFACMWGVQHLAVRAERWGPVITSQLASNAFGRVVPGGVAASGALQYAMLVRAGVPAAAAASGMTASSLLLFGTLLALPLLALPAVLGGVAVDPHLTRAALAGAALFVLMVALGAACVDLGPAADRRGPRLPGGPQPDPEERRAAHRRARAPAAGARHRRARARARSGGRR